MNPFNEKMALQSFLTIVRKELGEGAQFRMGSEGEWDTKRTSVCKEIMEVAGACDEQMLAVFSPAGERLGSFFLVWGNDPTGEELLADHTDNEFCERVWDMWSAQYD